MDPFTPKGACTALLTIASIILIANPHLQKAGDRSLGSTRLLGLQVLCALMNTVS